MIKRGVSSCLGVASALGSISCWYYIVLSKGDLPLQWIVGVLLASLAAALGAGILGSRVWFLALLGPVSVGMFLLSLQG